MAMLAEGRRKQKISSDPRGNAWRNDDNKFGQKLMEKMGWSKGKGLGANEDGNVDHVSISLRQDKRGVGCSKSHADNWIAHQDDFSALLAQLNESHKGESAGTPQKDTVQRMEEKSRTSKGRMHYQKFTKGKDLSAKSETDLDCVFGKRKSQSGTNTPDVQASSDEADEAVESSSHGVKTIRSTDSIQDYFARKMAERKNRAAGTMIPGSTDSLTGLDQGEENEGDNAVIENSDVEEDSGESKKKKKKSKKEKRRERKGEKACEVAENVESNLEAEKVSFVLGGEELDTEVTDKKSKKQKKKEKKLAEEASVVEPVVNEEAHGESYESKKKSKKSKKSRRKMEEDNEEAAECDKDTDNTCLIEDYTVSKKKAKKQKKRERDDE